MARIAQERTAVRKHPHKARQTALACQRHDLLTHTHNMVVEPPSRPMLYLAHRVAVLEAANDGFNHRVIRRVQGIDDGPGQLVAVGKGAQEIRQLGGRRIVIDAVIAGIRPQETEHLSVVVPLASIVELHGPIQLFVFPAHKAHEGGLVGQFFLPRNLLPAQPLGKDGLHGFFIGRDVHHVLQGMVGQAAAILMEIRHAGTQGFLHVRKGGNRLPGYLSQPGQVIHPPGSLDIHGLVRPPGRQYRYGERSVISQLLMIFQGIYRIIRGANQRYMAAEDQVAHTHVFFPELGIAQLPHFLRGFAVENALIAKEALQLQVAPMVQGVAHGRGQGLRPLLKLFPIRSISGNILFLYARGTHQPPLIVVAAQPNLRNIIKLPVLPDFLGIDVAVIIHYRHLLRVIVVEGPGCGCSQQKILVHESFHRDTPPYCCFIDIASARQRPRRWVTFFLPKGRSSRGTAPGELTREYHALGRILSRQHRR